MADVTVRYYAGARAAAGVETDVIHGVRTVEDALRRVRELRTGIDRLLPACSLLLNGVAVRDQQSTLGENFLSGERGAQVLLDVLPPFAGG
ncbi:hypothetical protein [Sciscionella marina]|uniref:hypothetical protein n=1 Tax=Sciscionella marina TaxID=508770 RepID=UPI00039D8530|nr:hypothetical protein [Sciscionella marina]